MSLRARRIAAAVERARKTANKKDCFDPNGSYTGTPDGGGMPVQDADDL